jgi:tripartite-type tricarboxylate transporter receptor subunit TctC
VLFETMTGTPMTHIPYKGGGPAMTDLVAGQVDMSFATTGSSIGFIGTGKLRALGVTSLTRSKVLPDVPTVAESVPGFEITSWYGVFTPSAIPRSLVPRLSKAVLDAVATPVLQERFMKLGSEPMGTTPAQFQKLVLDDTVRLTRIAKAAGIKAD